MAQQLCEFCGHNYPLSSTCMLVCDHSFHDSCIHEWSVYGKNCPLCRTTFQCTQHPSHSWLEEVYFRAAQAQQTTIAQLEADVQQLNLQHEIDKAQHATDQATIEENELQIQAQTILLMLSSPEIL